MPIKRIVIGFFFLHLFLCNVHAQDTEQFSANATVHKLNTEQYIQLKTIIAKYSNKLLQDTIIIKYDFNNDHCKDSLNKHSGVFIHTIIGSYNSGVEEVQKNRPGISVFLLREKGKGFIKYILWNKNILTDRNNEIYHLLFKRPQTCGSSAIILPGGIYILVSPDEHFVALQITNEHIAKLTGTAKEK